jgi:hypothetical protein
MAEIDPADPKFWENLEVSLKEVCEGITPNEKCVKKLYNKLKESESWELAIKSQFGNHSDLLSTLSQLSAANSTLFFQIFAARIFADRIVDNDLITEKAKKTLVGKNKELLSLELDDPKCLVIPIFFTNHNAIVDLFYENLISKFNIKNFYSVKKPVPKEPKSIANIDSIDKLLKKYDNSKKKRIKRKNHVWWVIEEGDKLKIYFRREKRAATPIKVVSHNEFIKTADSKILIFSDNGKRLDAYLGREPKRTLEIANFLAQQLYDPQIVYEEKVMEYPKPLLEPFISAIKNGNEKFVQLLGIRVRNVPLDGSPIMEIRSSNNEPINKNIVHLEKDHNLLLLSDLSSLESATVLIDGTAFNLRFNEDPEKVVITCSNKGYNEEEKKKVEKYFSSLKM